MKTQKVISRRKIIAWKSGKFSWELNCSFVSWPAIWDCQLKLGLCCVSTATALLRVEKAPRPVVALSLDWTLGSPECVENGKQVPRRAEALPASGQRGRQQRQNVGFRRQPGDRVLCEPGSNFNLVVMKIKKEKQRITNSTKWSQRFFKLKAKQTESTNFVPMCRPGRSCFLAHTQPHTWHSVRVFCLIHDC